jgi:cbb3-type cytochrome oxidase maturation protein
MSSLLILIPVALFLGLLGLAAFLWAMRSGQFDDLDGAGQRILFDHSGRDAPVESGKPGLPLQNSSSNGDGRWKRD